MEFIIYFICSYPVFLIGYLLISLVGFFALLFLLEAIERVATRKAKKCDPVRKEIQE